MARFTITGHTTNGEIYEWLLIATVGLVLGCHLCRPVPWQTSAGGEPSGGCGRQDHGWLPRLVFLCRRRGSHRWLVALQRWSRADAERSHEFHPLLARYAAVQQSVSNRFHQFRQWPAG